MHKLFILGAIALSLALPAAAQFTTVTGTVTDVNGLPYDCGAITATIVNLNGQQLYLNGQLYSAAPSPVALGCALKGQVSGSFTMNVGDNTQIKCGNTATGAIVTCATQTQWAFQATIAPGILPPAGTGPQFCNATVTISGASQSITSSFSACPALSKVVSSGVGFAGTNAQTVSYTAVAGDQGKLITMSGAGLTLTVPNPPPTSTWTITVLNLSTINNVTISRNGLNFDGLATNLTLGPTGGVQIYTDGSNYFTSSTMAGVLSGISGATNVMQVLQGNAGNDPMFIISNGGGGSISIGRNLGTLPIFVPAGNRFQTADQGTCTMAAGTCTAQALGSTYAAAPKCFATWTGTGALAGSIKIASTTTTVTPSSSNGADTAQVNFICFGN